MYLERHWFIFFYLGIELKLDDGSSKTVRIIISGGLFDLPGDYIPGGAVTFLNFIAKMISWLFTLPTTKLPN